MAQDKTLTEFLIEENQRLQAENIKLREQLVRFQLQQEQAEELMGMLQDIKSRMKDDDEDETDNDNVMLFKDKHEA